MTGQAAEKGGATMAVTGGFWAWLGTNYQAVGALCALIGVAIAIAGFAVNWWYLHRGRDMRP